MTKDNLTQIDQLLQRSLQANNRQLRQELKKDFKAEIDPIQERLDAQRVQINGVEKRLTGVEQQITGVEKRLSAQISLEVDDITGLIRDVIIPKLEQHDEQIAQLQEKIGIEPHRH
jgi:predicted  nucleic acid-binding Zn-ribbon protein